MKIRSIIIVLTALFFTACHPVQELETTVSPYQAGIPLDGKVLYALPRTSLVVRVTAVKTIYVPGPFRKYAEKYLGIQPYVTKAHTKWELREAELSFFKEPDPERYFMITTNGLLAENALTMTGSGLILDLASLPEKEMPAYCVTSEEPDGIPWFTDLSVKRNFYEKKDTVYRTIVQDTGFVRVPVVRKTLEKKTLEQKAEEAANFIIKIRKRRFKLMAGQYDVYPKDEALEFAVKEMTRLENEYLALFTGKQVSQKWHYRFIYTPDDPSRQPVLFRISPEDGVCNTAGCKGIPVYLQYDLPEQTVTGQKHHEGVATDTLFYRIPVLTDIKLMYNDRILAQKHIPVYQFGPEVGLPPTVILPDKKDRGR
jgi:hypothetical protein